MILKHGKRNRKNEEKAELIRSYTDWHQWFAWYPVTARNCKPIKDGVIHLDSYDLVWRETVWRRGYHLEWNIEKGKPKITKVTWEHRQLGAPPSSEGLN